MKILKARPHENELINTFHTLKFLKSMILTTSILLPLIIMSNNNISIYFLSSVLIFILFSFFYFDDKFQKMRKLKLVFKQNQKMFELEHENVLATDFFLRFNRNELQKGRRLSFEVNGTELVNFKLSDLLIKLGDNHFVILYNEEELTSIRDVKCTLYDKNGNIISYKQLNQLLKI